MLKKSTFHRASLIMNAQAPQVRDKAFQSSQRAKGQAAKMAREALLAIMGAPSRGLTTLSHGRRGAEPMPMS